MPMRSLVVSFLALMLPGPVLAESDLPVLRPELNTVWQYFQDAGCPYGISTAFVIALDDGAWLPAQAAADRFPDLAEWLDKPNTRACRFPVDRGRTAEVLGLVWPAESGWMVLVVDSPELSGSRMFDTLVDAESANAQNASVRELLNRLEALEGVHRYRLAPTPVPR